MKNPFSKAKAQRETIFHTLLDSNLPPGEKSERRMIDEGIVLIGAGRHTTAWALTVSTFHIVSNPTIPQNLKEEFSANKRNGQNLTLQELEKLPYLTAVIREGLRLAYGASVRLLRSSPDTALRFKDWIIPKGTPVSMTSVLQYQNEAISPDSRFFKPERWLEDKSGKLDKYLVSFNGGSRIYFAINLA